MDQSTLPTRQCVRIYLQRIAPVRRREIEERGKWSIFTSLDLLPQPKRRRVRRHANDDAADDNAADDDAADDDAADDDAADNDAADQKLFYAPCYILYMLFQLYLMICFRLYCVFFRIF